MSVFSPWGLHRSVVFCQRHVRFLAFNSKHLIEISLDFYFHRVANKFLPDRVVLQYR